MFGNYHPTGIRVRSLWIKSCFQLFRLKTINLFLKRINLKLPYAVSIIGTSDDDSYTFWLNGFKSMGKAGLPWFCFVSTPATYASLWWSLASQFSRLPSLFGCILFNKEKELAFLVRGLDGPILLKSSYFVWLKSHYSQFVDEFSNRFVVIGNLDAEYYDSILLHVSISNSFPNAQNWLDISNDLACLHHLESRVVTKMVMHHNYLPTVIYNLYVESWQDVSWANWDFSALDALPTLVTKIIGFLSILLSVIWLIVQVVTLI